MIALVARLLLAICLAGIHCLADAQEGRVVTSIDTGWLFHRGDSIDAAVPSADTGGWLRVSLPHTFNAGDGDHGGGYYRGPAWYRRTLRLPAPSTGRRLFLQFDGAALRATVWLNGALVGEHAGGYAGFRFDITDRVVSGDNLLAVRVDNARDPAIAPLGGDFTVFGGLFRDVWLVSTPVVHVDALDHGGPGVYVSTPRVTADHATVEVRVRVRDDGPAAGRTRARLRLRIEELSGTLVAADDSTAELPAAATSTLTRQLELPHPRLWRGRADPHLYRVVALVQPVDDAGDASTDRVAVTFGVRTFHVDPQRGFFLDGTRMPLHGVDLFHSGRPGEGLAVDAAQIDEDFHMMEAMGANAFRLVHFQHPPHAYDAADRDGIVLWTEIPLVAAVEDTPAFADNAVQQLRELIRQNFNHPAILFWGLGNELYRSDAASNALLDRLQATAASEDPSRLTVYAHCCGPDDAPHTRHTDVIAFNKYFGWYADQVGDIGAWADHAHARLGDRAMAVSEYGAGASVRQHEDPPRRPVTTGGWHPEEYQARFHERSWRALRARPWLWGTFAWVAFDLASDGRNEGDRAGINDKGLVTYDRRFRKDAYYWYQANWTTAPMLHITSARFTPRPAPVVTVRAYTNTRSAQLRLNGRRLGTRTAVDHVLTWTGVRLAPGDNVIDVRSTAPGTVRDRVVWRWNP